MKVQNMSSEFDTRQRRRVPLTSLPNLNELQKTPKKHQVKVQN